MSLVENKTLRKMRAGELALGFGVHAMRGSLVPLLASAAGYDWLFIDLEHSTTPLDVVAQISVAALDAGIAPLVRVPPGEYTLYSIPEADGGTAGTGKNGRGPALLRGCRASSLPDRRSRVAARWSGGKRFAHADRHR